MSDVSECYSPELRASVGNVSEITVAGLMGVNTVADGEACAAKGVQLRGKSWLLLATLSSSVLCSLHYRAEGPHQDITLYKSGEMMLFLCFETMGGREKPLNAICMSNRLLLMSDC